MTTDGLSQERAISSWENHLCCVGIAGRIKAQEDEPFFARTTGYKFGLSDLFFFQRSPSSHKRTKKDCSTNPSDIYFLTYVKKGALLVEQGDREAVIKAGDCCLSYSAEPSYFRLPTACEASAIMLHQSILNSWVASPFDLSAVSLLKSSPYGKALAALIDPLSPTTIDDISVSPDTFMDQIYCLLSIIAGPPKTSMGSYKQALFHRLYKSLRTRFCDANFNQLVLAREQGISTRTIQNTFTSAGTSFVKELLKIRMERARHYLNNSKYDSKNIAEISYLVGYHYASLFITHFHKVHGISPSVYRKTRDSNIIGPELRCGNMLNI